MKQILQYTLPKAESLGLGFRIFWDGMQRSTRGREAEGGHGVVVRLGLHAFII